MSGICIEVTQINNEGEEPTPKQRVEAVEKVARLLSVGPAEGSMMLLVAFLHMHRAYLRPEIAEQGSLDELLPTGFTCVDHWWPDAGKDTPGDVAANQNLN